MPKVTVTALCSVREKTGWTVQEVDCEETTVADVLKLVHTKDGVTLYDLLIEDGQIHPAYAAFVNGHRVEKLSQPLGDGDTVVAMDFIRVISGGETASLWSFAGQGDSLLVHK
ncbi:MAG: MoaD/ThiS family protein [Chloroflexi bacterium]|nr:MoaD/ThiS family protein [Chloroflexota bacterium]